MRKSLTIITIILLVLSLFVSCNNEPKKNPKDNPSTPSTPSTPTEPSEPTPVNPSTPVVDNRLKVTFDTNGGTFTNGVKTTIQRVNNGEKVDTTTLEEPTCEGATFYGWCTESKGSIEKFDLATTKITKDITLYAIWNYASVRKPIIECKSSDDYETTVTIYKNNVYGIVYYTLDGTDPDPSTSSKINGNKEDLTVTNGTLVKAMGYYKDTASDIVEYQTKKILDFYGYGTTSTSVRSMKNITGYNNRYEIEYYERDSRISLFVPSVSTAHTIGESVKPSATKSKTGEETNISILKVFEVEKNQLLVVARYGDHQASNGNAKGNIFYYYVDRTNGAKKTDEIKIDTSGLNIYTYTSSGSVELVNYLEIVQLINNKLYFVGDLEYTPEVLIYDLDTKTSSFVKLVETAYSGTVIIRDTFVMDNWLYAVGTAWDKTTTKLTFAYLWGLNTTDTSQKLEVKISDIEKTPYKATGKNNKIYIVTTTSTINNYARELICYDLTTSSFAPQATALSYQYNCCSTIGDMTFIGDKLLIVGSNTEASSGTSYKYPHRPCLWDIDGKQTILLQPAEFPTWCGGCGMMKPHTIQVSDGKIYILCDDYYDADPGYGNAIFKYPITHAGVISLDSNLEVLRVWDFGSGTYHRSLDSRINYFYMSSNK